MVNNQQPEPNTWQLTLQNLSQSSSLEVMLAQPGVLTTAGLLIPREVSVNGDVSMVTKMLSRTKTQLLELLPPAQIAATASTTGKCTSSVDMEVLATRESPLMTSTALTLRLKPGRSTNRCKMPKPHPLRAVEVTASSCQTISSIPLEDGTQRLSLTT